MALGRPRTFDPEQALDQALELFWRKGYEATTISDLTAAMGIKPPSLYAAFGDKEQLFRKALARYAARHIELIENALKVPRIGDAITELLHSTARILSDKSKPPGCLLVQGIAGSGDHAQCIRDELASRRAAEETLIRARLKRARAEGDLPRNADPAALARYIATVMQGMAVQAAGGASRAELKRIADTALLAFFR